MRFTPGWRRVLSAWGLLLILVLAGFAAVELRPSFCRAEAANPPLRGARIPQGPRVLQSDPFDLGPPAFGAAGNNAAVEDDATGDY